MKLVLIEWEDSHANGEWQEIGGTIEDRTLVCRSVGWLVLDGKNAKVIAPHINNEEPGVELQGCGVMTIPTRAVLRMIGLSEEALPYQVEVEAMKRARTLAIDVVGIIQGIVETVDWRTPVTVQHIAVQHVQPLCEEALSSIPLGDGVA